MACQYYKTCSAYDPDKDVCDNGGECSTYDQLFIEQQNRVSPLPSFNPERITVEAGLEIMTIEETVKTKKKHDKQRTERKVL